MREMCGNCKWNRRSYDGHHNAEYCCGNENSSEYAMPTFYDDTCDDWEPKYGERTWSYED